MGRTLHVFNPEHDIALALGLSNFTAPHAGRQLRADLGWLPALWAEAGDAVLVDNVAHAGQAWRRVCHRLAQCHNSFPAIQKAGEQTPPFVTAPPSSVTSVQPWGWDSALCAALLRRGVAGDALPSAAQLEDIRQLSHRRVAGQVLRQLSTAGTVGQSFECADADQVSELLEQFGQVVLKAPWSSSGRGVRFVSTLHASDATHNWLRNIIERQGSVMVEPLYNKVKDFGMEFQACDDGTVKYVGLSLFHTANGAYTGNILATEEVKRAMMSRWIPTERLDGVREELIGLLATATAGRYQGPLGVDMMVVASQEGLRLHPCVEINLRRTMGHVALALTPTDEGVVRVMRIEYNGQNYKLKICKT